MPTFETASTLKKLIKRNGIILFLLSKLYFSIPSSSCAFPSHFPKIKKRSRLVWEYKATKCS